MVTAQDLCSVFGKVLKDGWGVVPGFDGQVLTQDMIDERITDENLKKSASKWVGKHVVDSGGLFAYAFRVLGRADNYVPDGTYPTKIFRDFCGESGKLPRGGLLPGMVMFKKHGNNFTGVGLYIGNNTIISAISSKTGVVSTKLNSEWTYWGKLSNFEYDELPSKASLRKKDIRDMRVLRGPVVVGKIEQPVNVRDDKSMSSKIIDALPPGTQATVIEDCGEFCKVQYVKTGYMKKEFLLEVTQ